MAQRRRERFGLDAIAVLLPGETADTNAGECGTTLVELLLVVGVIMLATLFAAGALAQRPAQTRSAAIAFSAFISDARTLAAVTADRSTGGSGSTIGVVRAGDEYVATLYAYRPALGGPQPVAEPNTPPLRMATSMNISQFSNVFEPPFALFFSASGHLSARAPFRVGVDAPLAAEPDCPLEHGIIVTFSDGVSTASYPLSCESAQLDLSAPQARAP